MVFVFLVETRVWDAPLKFRFRGASVNPPVSFSFPCFWTGPLCLCWLDTYLEQFTTGGGETRATRKIHLLNVLYAFRIPFMRGGPAVSGDLCDGQWYLQKPNVNYLISGFVSKFLASGLSLFFYRVLYLCCPGQDCKLLFCPPSPHPALGQWSLSWLGGLIR